MLTAELRRLHSPDVYDLRTFAPPDPRNFGLLVQAMVGPKDMPGEESFDFVICTPRWFEERLSEKRYALGRHYLFLAGYDYELLVRAIRELCEQATGSDWVTVARSLARYGKWEFEDYRPSVPEP